MVEEEAGENDDAPLWNEGCQAEQRTRALIVQLINHVPVDRDVVSIVLAHQMVQVTLIKEFIAVQAVEEVCQPQKSARGDKREY